MPFLKYSSLHWGAHAKMKLSDHAKPLAFQLLNRYDSHISSRFLYDQTKFFWHRQPSHPSVPGLHCASYFGIDEVITTLIEMEDCDINQGDCMGLTPLMWACRQGNQGTVTLLLTQGDIDPGKPDSLGETPLWWASYNGYEGVVRLLLSRSAINPDQPDNNSPTPLLSASSNSNEEVVRPPVVQDDATPGDPENDALTSLQPSSSNGHEEVVRSPVARDDFTPDEPHHSGQAPPKISLKRSWRQIISEYIPQLSGKKRKGN